MHYTGQLCLTLVLLRVSDGHAVLSQDVQQLVLEAVDVLFDLVDVVLGDASVLQLLLLGGDVAPDQGSHHAEVLLVSLLLVLDAERGGALYPAHAHQAHHALRRRDDIERRRQRATVLEVAHPQLGAGELPLEVRPFLQVVRVAVMLSKHRCQNGSEMNCFIIAYFHEHKYAVKQTSCFHHYF